VDDATYPKALLNGGRGVEGGREGEIGPGKLGDCGGREEKVNGNLVGGDRYKGEMSL